MTERSIEDLLGRDPRPTGPDPAFEARLRRRLTQELTAPDGEGTAPATEGHEATTSPVLELETSPSRTVATMRVPMRWLQAGAAAAVVAVVAALVVAATRDDDSSVTVAAPDATFVGASVETITLDLGPNDPYFVAAHEDAWVLTLAGDLIRIDDSGEAVSVATVPEASPLAVDEGAIWVADAVHGGVLRLDPVDGSVVAEIETGIEVVPNTIRIPMPFGASRQFAMIGGIASNGESVWVGDRAGRVLRIDAATNDIVDSFVVPVRPDQLQLDGDHLLVVNPTGGEAVVVDSISGEGVHPAEVLDDLAGAAVHDGALYLQDASDGTVTRIDLGSGAERTSQPIGPSVVLVGQPVLPTGLVVSAAGVLVDTATKPASMHVLDPETLVETGTLAVEADHGDMSVAPDGSVWLVRGSAHTVIHITPRPL